MKDCVPGGFAAELNIVASIGPMCNSLRDCDLFLRVVKASKPWLEDPRLIPLPWTGLSTKLELPIKIGIMKHDGAIVPQPPVLNALKWAEEQLSSSKEVTLKPYFPYEAATAMANTRLAYWPDSGLSDKAECDASGEPMHPLTHWIIKDAEDSVQRNGTEVKQMRWKRDVFRSEFVKHWNKQDVDFVICPVFVGPASAHDTALYCKWSFSKPRTTS